MGSSATSYIGCGFKISQDHPSFEIFDSEIKGREFNGAPKYPSSDKFVPQWWEDTEKFSLKVSLCLHGSSFSDEAIFYVLDESSMQIADWDGEGQTISADQLAEMEAARSRMLELAARVGVTEPVNTYWLVNYG